MMDDAKRRKLNETSFRKWISLANDFPLLVSAIETFEKLSKYNQPGLAQSKETNKTLLETS